MIRVFKFNYKEAPYETMFFLSYKQENTDDLESFIKEYGFSFRNYELVSNIYKKYVNDDESYKSDFLSAITALRNSTNKYIREIYAEVPDDLPDESVFNPRKYAHNDRFFESIRFSFNLQQLIAELITCNHEVSTIYDASCLNASVVARIKNFEKATLYEEDKDNYLLAIQNMIIRNIPLENVNIINGRPGKDKFKYDTSISILLDKKSELSGILQPKYDEYVGRNPFSEYLLDSIIHLDDNGVLIALVSLQQLVRLDTYNLRKCLLERNYIDAVIQLDNNVESMYLLIINKNKKTDDILFIVTGYIPRRMNNFDNIIECYKNREVIKYFSNIVTNDELIDNESNLNPKKYVYTLKYEVKSIDELVDKQKEYIEEIRVLDEKIDEQLKKLINRIY